MNVRYPSRVDIVHGLGVRVEIMESLSDLMLWYQGVIPGNYVYRQQYTRIFDLEG